MEEEKKSGEKILDLAGDMIENYRSLVTLKIAEHASLAGSASILGILLLVVAVFVLLFAGLGCAWWLGETLHNMKAGFFIVGAVYTVVLLVLLLIAKKTLLPAIRNLIIKKIYEED
ncbi:MAG TPA: phage holin family protein [Cyclobacteriaceae bacterium]|nr:phage holin family protein [Cyclobacteriaceae bacterium]